MSPGQFLVFEKLIEAMFWVGFFGALAGVAAYFVLVRVLSWLVAVPVGRRYREYRAACGEAFVRGMLK